MRFDGWRRSRWDWRWLRKSEREEQILPGWEDQVGRYRRRLAEEIVARSKLCPLGAPEFVRGVADGVQGEGQQVQAYQNGGEIFLSVSEAVLKVVALVLQYVEGLVLDLSPGAAAGDQFDDSSMPGAQWRGLDLYGAGPGAAAAAAGHGVESGPG